MPLKTISEIDIYKKIVLIRADLNVPIRNNVIESDARILATLPTIQFALQKKAKVIIMSHLGRPKEGIIDKNFSLYPIFEYFKKILPNHKIKFSNTYLNEINKDFQELTILENVRFNLGEKNNDTLLAKKYASLCDVFVMDAFGCAHRKQASTHKIIQYAKQSCAGLLFMKEINSLTTNLINPERPMVAIIGGSKVSTKFNVLKSITKIADTTIVGGGIANTFIAINNNIGQSLYEPEFINAAKKLKNKYNILVPIDSHVKINQNQNFTSTIKKISDINENEEIMDMGTESIKNMIKVLKNAKTILWNGPVGVFEILKFRTGTEALAKTIADSHAFSIAGGGDTLSVIDMFNIKKNISYISTGGGAFLEFIEGKKLPTISILEKYKL
ncbi:Phosphoglycerate kinase [Buchnera aphidicola (Eriosoma grossulariae)]|uniref:phosphoglycerate kinase n=1 Tax=Buchnera aphidicola TaxID=9 RepID=UPI0034641DE9